MQDLPTSINDHCSDKDISDPVNNVDDSNYNLDVNYSFRSSVLDWSLGNYEMLVVICPQNRNSFFLRSLDRGSR